MIGNLLCAGRCATYRAGRSERACLAGMGGHAGRGQSAQWGGDRDQLQREFISSTSVGKLAPQSKPVSPLAKPHVFGKILTDSTLVNCEVWCTCQWLGSLALSWTLALESCKDSPHFC